MSLNRFEDSLYYYPSKVQLAEALICAEQMNLAFREFKWFAVVSKSNRINSFALGFDKNNNIQRSLWNNGNWSYIPLSLEDWMKEDLIVYDWIDPSSMTEIKFN